MNCKRAAELTSRALDVPLPVGSRFALGLHRALCPACRRFREQLEAIDRAAAEFVAAGTAPDAVGMAADVHERIRLHLRETAGQS